MLVVGCWSRVIQVNVVFPPRGEVLLLNAQGGAKKSTLEKSSQNAKILKVSTAKTQRPQRRKDARERRILAKE